ncbi:hypothetical protein KAX29_04910 [candidate division WOR-3 bacterium]|nr:hypothetical protein [candidate division WOR-3 bacterium]
MKEMTREDYDIAKQWDKEGLVNFGRLPFHYIEKKRRSRGRAVTHFVIFTKEAWSLIHKIREERGMRMIERFHNQFPDILNK